jgi:uncharacterized protein
MLSVNCRPRNTGKEAVMNIQMQDASAKPTSYMRVMLSLRAGIILALANIACAGILARAWVAAKAEPKVISVTGSAKKQITSDLIVWNCGVSVQNVDLARAAASLDEETARTVAYLKEQGVADAELTISSITTARNMVKDEKGNPTDKVSSYELSQDIEVTSKEVLKIASIERRVTGLIKDGVMLHSQPPNYLYTKMAELKITMLAEATKDAHLRAEQIATNSGAALGAIRDAKMGVMQINALHDDRVSGYGVNDTSSYEKEITAVVTARFDLQ